MAVQPLNRYNDTKELRRNNERNRRLLTVYNGQ